MAEDDKALCVEGVLSRLMGAPTPTLAAIYDVIALALLPDAPAIAHEARDVVLSQHGTVHKIRSRNEWR